MTPLSLIPGLPNDLNFPIFSSLSPIELGIGCQVSHAWNQYCSSDEFWTRFPELTAYWNQDIKKSVNLHAVGSYADVAREFEKFTNSLKSEGVLPRWEGNFSCIFPYNTEYTIHLKLGYGNLGFLKRPTDTCTRLFMRPLSNKSTADFSVSENSAVASPHGTMLNPGYEYREKRLTINNSAPGAPDLSLRINDITDRCIERLRPLANRGATMCTLYLISSACIFFAALYFRPNSY